MPNWLLIAFVLPRGASLDTERDLYPDFSGPPASTTGPALWELKKKKKKECIYSFRHSDISGSSVSLVRKAIQKLELQNPKSPESEELF